MTEAEFDDALASHTLAEMRRRMIDLALERHKSVRRAAKALGIGRATLYRAIAEMRVLP